MDMPVFFYIDPEFATDARMRGINHLTLSYTFFNVEEEAWRSTARPCRRPRCSGGSAHGAAHAARPVYTLWLR